MGGVLVRSCQQDCGDDDDKAGGGENSRQVLTALCLWWRTHLQSDRSSSSSVLCHDPSSFAYLMSQPQHVLCVCMPSFAWWMLSYHVFAMWAGCVYELECVCWSSHVCLQQWSKNHLLHCHWSLDWFHCLRPVKWSSWSCITATLRCDSEVQAHICLNQASNDQHLYQLTGWRVMGVREKLDFYQPCT